MDVKSFWKAVLAQDEEEIRKYFHEDAWINWNCTNEHFTVDEYIVANCEYPGEWDGEVERIEKNGAMTITVAHVYTTDRALSFYVTSFMKIRDGKIESMDEYWADEGTAPKWRIDKHIGTAIR